VPEKLSLEALNKAGADDFAAALANIVEHSPWVAGAAARARPFANLVALRDAIAAAIRDAPPAQRLALIRAHPDLANRLQRAAGLTAESLDEQDGAGLDRLSDAEFALFEQANDAYKAKFGFPFIVCVRRHGKDSILGQFSLRLQNAPAQEEAAAVDEIVRIASLRLAQRVTGDGSLPVHGHLSTHVLDNHLGRPAVGLAFELIELSRHGESRTLVKATTNRDGRTPGALIEGRPVPIGTYELRFHTHAYFAGRAVPLADPPFYDVITIRFSVADPEGRYHVPLLLTPWSYTTYRGS
jgi:2-oxo-4-hydroxy-4-carboxy-5-ureidoimidazoline decarboxylase